MTTLLPTSAAVQDAVADVAATAPAARRYAMYGLGVTSDVPLPLPLTSSAPDGWTVRLAPPGTPAPAPTGGQTFEERCDCPRHAGRPITRVFRGPDGDWIWSDRAGTCTVAPDGKGVEVYAAPDADSGDVALMLLGPVSGLALGRLGFPCLHASAVDTGAGAVVFLGPPGHGKTTMAAALLRRGAPLLTDDVLPLWPRADGIFGRPGAPVMKLWAQTASGSLGLEHGLPRLSPTLGKMWLTLDESRPYAVSERALPLRALYVLQRYDPPADAGPEPEIEEIPLGARDAVAVLLAQTYRGEFLRPQEAAALLPLYSRLAAQAPVRLLRYPNGFRHQDRLCARLLGDARSSGASAGAAGAAGAAKEGTRA